VKEYALLALLYDDRNVQRYWPFLSNRRPPTRFADTTKKLFHSVLDLSTLEDPHLSWHSKEFGMMRLSVPDMSCGHCTAAIEKAIKAIDPTAKVSCDLGAHIVEVERYLSERAISEAIRDVGYDVKAPAAT
jgi:copper chaperone|tara:strand:- start:2295 stop:2687 length:393 start_codon:yes stop_codon:yes gene_type:complete